MGLVCRGLGPADAATVAELGPEIVRVLRRAAAEIEQGRGRAESTTWFGDTAAPWMRRLQAALNKMASVVNTKDINIGFATLERRKAGSYAAAFRPTGGWNVYTDLTTAEGRNFTIRLNLRWNSTPLYRTPPGTPGDSKFQTLVHELTHLILGTEDVRRGGATCYGVAACQALAQASPANAKDNADNWGYFVEEFR